MNDIKTLERMAGERLLSRAECERIIRRVKGAATGGGDIWVKVGSYWTGHMRWARNRVNLAGDALSIAVSIGRQLPGFAESQIQINQTDPASLEAAVRYAERKARAFPVPRATDVLHEPPQLSTTSGATWSAPTYAMTADERSETIRGLTRDAEAAGMLSSGFLQITAFQDASDSERLAMYGLQSEYALHQRGARFGGAEGVGYYSTSTIAQCAITVRDPRGRGSGWAGASATEWARLDTAALADRALRKCLQSRNARAIEPGRYTVILEPQAVYDLMASLVSALQARELAESSASHPMWLGQDVALGLGRSKLGLKVIDERISISHDPSDPDLPGEPVPGMAPVTWIEKGVLKALSFWRESYGLESVAEEEWIVPRAQFRMSGGTATIEEMIATTRRGLLVTRLFDVNSGGPTLLTFGMTRDGVWLIENGAITHPIKNLMFAESPLYVLNQVEQLGVPHKILGPAVVPPIKVRDFNFNALIDAV